MNSKKYITAFVIFSINTLTTYYYFEYFIGNFNAYDLWEAARYSEEHSTYFLFDVLQYQVSDSTADFIGVISGLSEGSTAIHAFLLKSIFGGEGGLETSIFVNSAFIALTLSLIKANLLKTLKIYVLLSPFFIFYSIGWSKEILLTLGLTMFFVGLEFQTEL